MQTPLLNIPHASLQERDFVLKPLVDLAPKLLHPVFKKTIEVIWLIVIRHFI